MDAKIQGQRSGHVNSLLFPGPSNRSEEPAGAPGVARYAATRGIGLLQPAFHACRPRQHSLCTFQQNCDTQHSFFLSSVKNWQQQGRERAIPVGARTVAHRQTRSGTDNALITKTISGHPEQEGDNDCSYKPQLQSF